MAHSSLLAQLEELRRSPPGNNETRSAVHNALVSTAYALERPIDTLFRLAFTSIQPAITRVAIDLKIPEILCKAEQPLTITQLANQTGADPVLLNRILRYEAAYGLVSEKGPGIYAACPTTRTIADPAIQAGIRTHSDVQTPSWAALPQFFEKKGFHNPASNADCPFQVGHRTELQPFAWFVKQPHALMQEFGLYMAALRDMNPMFTDTFPLERFLDSSSSTPVFVDVGGAIGHQCAILQKTTPGMTRPIVLQDLAPVVAKALPVTNMEAMAIDFFQSQPVKGAQYYYLKSVLHDWPDDLCKKILEVQIEAMGKDSALLIDEMVLPDTGVHWRAVALDIALMANAAGMERSKTQWEQLFDEVGLRIEETFYYDPEVGTAVMVVRKQA